MLLRGALFCSMVVGVIAATPARADWLNFNPFYDLKVVADDVLEGLIDLGGPHALPPNFNNVNDSSYIPDVVTPYIAADGSVWAGSNPQGSQFIGLATVIHAQNGMAWWAWGSLRHRAPQFDLSGYLPIKTQIIGNLHVTFVRTASGQWWATWKNPFNGFVEYTRFQTVSVTFTHIVLREVVNGQFFTLPN